MSKFSSFEEDQLIFEHWRGHLKEDAGSVLDAAQIGLGIIGLGADFFGGVGAPFDLLNAGISTLRGDPVMAILNAISAIPVGGDAVGKGAIALLMASKLNLKSKVALKSLVIGSKVYSVGDRARSILGMIQKIQSQIQKVLNPQQQVIFQKEVVAPLRAMAKDRTPAAKFDSQRWQRFLQWKRGRRGVGRRRA